MELLKLDFDESNPHEFCHHLGVGEDEKCKLEVSVQ